MGPLHGIKIIEVVGLGAAPFCGMMLADMGILLTFMFLVNMLGAILLLPALASWLLRSKHQAEGIR